MLKGIYISTKKDGTTYYRVSLTYKNKHISLGSTDDLETAQRRYQLATAIVRNNRYTLLDFNKTDQSMDYEKWVIIHNFRDNGLYFKTPIYLYKSFFTYHLTQHHIFSFDVDDLFFYSNHKIFRRGNYFFVNDFGMQMNILGRYGIKNYASMDKDYRFIDGNCYNLRYENIEIINPYVGVERVEKDMHTFYRAKIHLNGYIVIGYYQSIHKAAVAYNKAVDFVHRYLYPNKNYGYNYVDAISEDEMNYYYTSIQLPDYLIQKASIDLD